MRGLSCYNNPNRLTGKVQAVRRGGGGGLWEGSTDQSEGLVKLWEAGLPACAAL